MNGWEKGKGVSARLWGTEAQFSFGHNKVAVPESSKPGWPYHNRVVLLIL